jgi:hypothetical protein
MTQSTFACKPDWAKAQARWDAFWDLQPMDRPCLAVTAPRADRKTGPLPEVGCIEDKWMDPAYLLAQSVKRLDENYLGGEAVPTSGHLMACSTLGCGRHLQFHEGGISIRPAMSGMDQPGAWQPGPADPWRARVEAIYNRLLDAAPGRFMVPYPVTYPPIDLLNMLRGNEAMLMDLAMVPEQCEQRLRELRELALENSDHFRQFVDSRQGDVGCVGWSGVWCRQFYLSAQADVAAMISPDMFERFVLPELDFFGEAYERLWFHTCGYKQHLDMCLSRPYIRVIQYSPSLKEPTNGPAHLEFYRRVQQARRGLDLNVCPEHVEFLIRHLRPEGLFISTSAGTLAEADELLAHAVRWAGSHANREG